MCSYNTQHQNTYPGIQHNTPEHGSEHAVHYTRMYSKACSTLHQSAFPSRQDKAPCCRPVQAYGSQYQSTAPVVQHFALQYSTNFT